MSFFDDLLPEKKRRAKPAIAAENATRADSNAILRKVVGKRFSDARAINGWDQGQAAKMLGYQNSTQLSLIEQGKRLPPHKALLKASEVYGVSLDYLMGVSDEPERDPKAAERAAGMRSVRALIESSAQQQIGLLMQYLAQGVPAVNTARVLLARCEAMVNEVNSTRKLNAKLFDEKLKNGNKLVRSAEDAAEACVHAREMLARHERITEFKTRTKEAKAGVTHPLLDLLDDSAATGARVQ